MTEPQHPEEGLLTIRPVAWYRGLLPEKFGLPRQSGLVEQLRSTIVFTPEFRNPDALRPALRARGAQNAGHLPGGDGTLFRRLPNHGGRD